MASGEIQGWAHARGIYCSYGTLFHPKVANHGLLEWATESRGEGPTWKQYLARIGCHRPKCSVWTKPEPSAWHCVPVGRIYRWRSQGTKVGVAPVSITDSGPQGAFCSLSLKPWPWHVGSPVHQKWCSLARKQHKSFQTMTCCCCCCC